LKEGTDATERTGFVSLIRQSQLQPPAGVPDPIFHKAAIDAVPSADLARLKKDNRFSLVRGGPAALVHYIALDSARDVSPFITAKDGKPLDRNPLKDARVRKALSLALNRALMVDRVLEGSGVPAGQMLSDAFPTAPKDVKPDPHDLLRAQALLKEAGWAQGFRIVLHTTNDRYPGDAAIAQAVAQMWTRLGLKAEVETLPGSVFFTRASKQEFSAFAAQYGAEEAANSLRALVATSRRPRASARPTARATPTRWWTTCSRPPCRTWTTSSETPWWAAPSAWPWRTRR
jgi:peptide/nickel transport system substrate-binding protein